jgi:hypothetical protein
MPMKSEMTSALTPALSPRRGRIIRCVLSHAMFRVVVCVTVNDTESGTAMEIENFQRRKVLSLPEGEVGTEK